MTRRTAFSGTETLGKLAAPHKLDPVCDVVLALFLNSSLLSYM